MNIEEEFKKIYGNLPSNSEQYLGLLKFLIESDGATIKEVERDLYKITLNDFIMVKLDEKNDLCYTPIEVGPYDFKTLILASYLKILDEWGEEVCYHLIDFVRGIIEQSRVSS